MLNSCSVMRWGSIAPTFLAPPDYVELRCATAFSFLRGASQPEEMVARAAALGYKRLAITDHDGLYGIVRAYQAGKQHGVEILVGAEVHLRPMIPAERAAAPALIFGRRTSSASTHTSSGATSSSAARSRTGKASPPRSRAAPLRRGTR